MGLQIRFAAVGEMVSHMNRRQKIRTITWICDQITSNAHAAVVPAVFTKDQQVRAIASTATADNLG